MRTEQRDLARERHWICAQRLRERRRELGLTQVEVVTALCGHGVGLTNRALSAMEHGHALDLGWLPDLAAVLDCTTTYLLGLTTDAHRWQPDTEPVSGTGPARSADPAAPEDGGWILGPNVPDRHSSAR